MFTVRFNDGKLIRYVGGKDWSTTDQADQASWWHTPQGALRLAEVLHIEHRIKDIVDERGQVVLVPLK